MRQPRRLASMLDTPAGRLAPGATLEPLELERQAVAALRDGQVQAAFRLADRRCRTGPIAPHCFVLRAEALDRMGLRDLALVDLLHALALAPQDGLANRRMMLWGEGDERLEAAAQVVRRDRDPLTRAQAFRLLEAAGRPDLAEIEVFDCRITGWATWREPGFAAVEIDGGENECRWQLVPDPRHPFDGRGCFALFDIPRPRSETPQSVSVVHAGRSLATVRMAPNRPARTSPRGRSEGAGHPEGVAVIVPVYADHEATLTCLDSVLASFGASARHSLVVVDDASPEPRLSEDLRVLAAAGRITLLVNPRNLGFVGAVNRALAAVKDRDIVLLNADTMVPHGFADRLAATARSAPEIGTVTPLSNNGEFLSFPRPNRGNPLPRPEELRRFDAAAACANAGTLVDLPSGIGFCLYVTRACLDAVGGLCEDYHRGYLEDVDFCLRARAAGFRNVADPSIFVGHAGSRSFAAAKRALVVRNLAVLERRFPGHRAECRAFMSADPLRLARDRIERHLGPPPARPVVVVVSAGPVAAVAQARACQLAAAAQPVILVEIAGPAGDVVARVSDPTGGVPQSLRFTLGPEDEALQRYLEGLDSTGIELFDAHRLPASLKARLADLGRPVDVILADSGMLPALGLSGSVPLRWPASAASGLADEPAAVLPAFGRIIAPSAEAEALLGSRCAARLPGSFGRPNLRKSQPSGAEPHLGLVPVFHTPGERDLIGAMAQALLGRLPRLALTVLGAVQGEDHLASRDSIFVTGPIDGEDLERIRFVHGVTALMILLDRPIFGHPALASAQRCDCPVAAIDWSGGRLPPLSGDLAIAPRTSLDEAADCLAAWLSLTHRRTEQPVMPLRSVRC